MRRPIALLLTLALFAGCKRTAAPAGRAPTGPIARVLIDSSGVVELDGRPTLLPALTDSLRALALHNGGVVYSRVNPDQPPNPAQDSVIMKVLTVIIGARLPVRLVRPESLATAGKK